MGGGAVARRAGGVVCGRSGRIDAERRRAGRVRHALPAQDKEAVAVTANIRAVLRVVVAMALLAAPRVALACPVCFGQSDSPLARGVNMGVLFMLGTITAVLIGFAAFMIYLARRARVFAGDNIDASEETA